MFMAEGKVSITTALLAVFIEASWTSPFQIHACFESSHNMSFILFNKIHHDLHSVTWPFNSSIQNDLLYKFYKYYNFQNS